MLDTFPDRIDMQHCLITRKYAIYTPPMHDMIAQIGDWIDQQRPGGYIYGASRLGKSRCIQWHLKEVLEKRFNARLPLIVWNRRADSHKSEASFWYQILRASNFEYSFSAKPPKRAEAAPMCVQRLISIAKSTNQNYIILLIDEAQDMTLIEWKWLVGLQNDLDYQGYMLSIFSVGSHQLNYRHDYMASTGNAHIAARFMAAHYPFHGLRSAEELAYVLNGYDEDSEWPKKSGVSFLQYFAPDDYHSGRRLSHKAEDMWKALIELSPVGVSRKYQEFPMQHISNATESIIFQLSRGKDWDKAISYKNILSEISKTNFSDHMRIISTG
ncbi:ATP-binding protein [Comamonas aquatica]|uniref:ATP-binding protein n=1 Tax=Comamonas aquatica TaxID=225991 RepID=UPI000684B0E0|nr:ATP-binding protein [Comamonas aquatica]